MNDDPKHNNNRAEASLLEAARAFDLPLGVQEVRPAVVLDPLSVDATEAEIGFWVPWDSDEDGEA